MTIVFLFTCLNLDVQARSLTQMRKKYLPRLRCVFSNTLFPRRLVSRLRLLWVFFFLLAFSLDELMTIPKKKRNSDTLP